MSQYTYYSHPQTLTDINSTLLSFGGRNTPLVPQGSRAFSVDSEIGYRNRPVTTLGARNYLVIRSRSLGPEYLARPVFVTRVAELVLKESQLSVVDQATGLQQIFFGMRRFDSGGIVDFLGHVDGRHANQVLVEASRNYDSYLSWCISKGIKITPNDTNVPEELRQAVIAQNQVPEFILTEYQINPDGSPATRARSESTPRSTPSSTSSVERLIDDDSVFLIVNLGKQASTAGSNRFLLGQYDSPAGYSPLYSSNFFEGLDLRGLKGNAGRYPKFNETRDAKDRAGFHESVDWVEYCAFVRNLACLVQFLPLSTQNFRIFEHFVGFIAVFTDVFPERNRFGQLVRAELRQHAPLTVAIDNVHWYVRGKRFMMHPIVVLNSVIGPPPPGWNSEHRNTKLEARKRARAHVARVIKQQARCYNPDKALEFRRRFWAECKNLATVVGGDFDRHMIHDD